MTGFARAEGTRGDNRWHWEVRSVNGRGLDVRTRLPSGSEMLEQKIRATVTKMFQRGNITITLTAQRLANNFQIKLNEQALTEVLAAADTVKTTTGSSPPSVDGLLGLKGVLEVSEGEESADDLSARHEAMLTTLQNALKDLQGARAEEGARLETVLSDQIGEIEKLHSAIEISPMRKPDAIKQRLKDNITKLIETSDAFDPERLHQEAVIMATRADVEEELKRLGAHIASAKDLLKSDQPVGRKFDFLAQEFHREANTICSKANDIEITQSGMALKVIIDQMREQVQNIE